MKAGDTFKYCYMLTQPLGDMNEMKADWVKALSEVCRTLSHTQRLALVEALSEGPRCVSTLQTMLNTTQPQISYHLAKLRHMRLVVARRRGQQMMYELANPDLLPWLADANQLLRGYEGGSLPTPSNDSPSICHTVWTTTVGGTTP